MFVLGGTAQIVLITAVMTPLTYVAAAANLPMQDGNLLAIDSQPLTEEQKIIHVLNRLGYGARPGDVEQVEKMGLEKYLQQQLHPERVDDSAVEKKLAAFDALEMKPSDLMESLHEDQRMMA